MLPIKLNKFLLQKYLFYKHYYKFIFLHKPLCQKYRNFSFKFLGMYFCKSCFLLYLGFFSTLAIILPKLEIITLDKFFILGVCGILLTAFVSYPGIYNKFSRSSQYFIRFYDGIFLAIYFTVFFKLDLAAGFLSILLFLIVKHIFNKKRNLDLCKGCPELPKETTCEGYLEQKQALLDIDEEYSKIITNIMIKQGKEI